MIPFTGRNHNVEKMMASLSFKNFLWRNTYKIVVLSGQSLPIRIVRTYGVPPLWHTFRNPFITWITYSFEWALCITTYFMYYYFMYCYDCWGNDWLR